VDCCYGSMGDGSKVATLYLAGLARILQKEGAKMLRTGRMLSLVLLCASPGFLFAGPVPAVGSKAPRFTLQSQDGQMVRLKDYRGRWVVLFFYPFPGRCAMETDNFQRDRADYEKKNTVILGVSVDDVGSQKNCIHPLCQDE